MKTEAIMECIFLAETYNGEAEAVAREASAELRALLDRITDLQNQLDYESQQRQDRP